MPINVTATDQNVSVGVSGGQGPAGPQGPAGAAGAAGATGPQGPQGPAGAAGTITGLAPVATSGSASDLTSGTLADDRLSQAVQNAENLYLWAFSR